MEELKHFKSLRSKYAKELVKASYEGALDTRPQTAPKQVNFDFSDHLDLRELRNLRERHLLELNRIKTPPCNEEPAPKKKKHQKKRSKKTTVFEALQKPAIELAHFSKHPSPMVSYRKIEKKVPSSKHSVCSEVSSVSKKTLKEEMEEVFNEAKKALEKSFSRASSHISEKPSGKANEDIDRFSNKSLRNPEFMDHRIEFSNRSHTGHFQESEHKYNSGAIRDDLHASIHSEIEEKELESLKSSVDFTLSDNTPFESLKFSHENHKLGFNQYFENLKKGIFYRLLSPIIQQFQHESSFENSVMQEIPHEFSSHYIEKNPVLSNFESIKAPTKNRNNGRMGHTSVPETTPRKETLQIENPKRNFELAQFESNLDSPKGSERINRRENMQEQVLRTSRSMPFDHLTLEESIYSHNSELSISNNCDFKVSTLEQGEISLMHIPEIPRNKEEVFKEKATIMLKVLENIELSLVASNCYLSLLQIKARSDKLKDKVQKLKLAEANFEFTTLKKVMSAWRVKAKEKIILSSKKFQQHIDKWKFLKLYQTFQGLKYLCKAHKQWIEEVKAQLEAKRILSLFKNWALFVRYRNVKQYLKFKKAKTIVKNWRQVCEKKKEFARTACVHWYYNTIGKVTDRWAHYAKLRQDKKKKNATATNCYNEKILTKVFLCWKHSKALQKASYIPLRISTKTILIKKDGNIQEKCLMDIKIIKNS